MSIHPGRRVIPRVPNQEYHPALRQGFREQHRPYGAAGFCPSSSPIMEASQVLPDRPAPKIHTTFSGFTPPLEAGAKAPS
jgi:hypothetical protein